MAGEKKIENSESVAAGLKTDSCTELTEQDVASENEGILSDLTSSISSSGDTTTCIKGEIDQESVAEQGVHYPPTSCYDYYYPGFMGAVTQSDDHGYLNAGGGSFTGIQSDNSSFLYYMPDYTPYTIGTFMGVDGQQPYFTSSEYLNPPASYGSEVMPCYSWDSTHVGGFSNGTIAISGNVKSVPGSKGSVKSYGLNSTKTKNTLASKTTSLAVDSKLRQHTASANFSKPTLQNQTLKPLNKSGSGFQSAGLVKGFRPLGKFSSYTTNQSQGLFTHNGQMNYQPNGRVWNGNNNFRLREKSDRNGEFEASTELTRGPRAHNMISPSNSSVEDEQAGFTIRRDQYNLEVFRTDYANAKFYVIKSYSEDDIHKSIKYDVWSSTPNGNKKLDSAFRNVEVNGSSTGTRCPVFLFFSVNGSGQFVGLAEMIGQVDFKKNMDFWQLDKWSGFFPVKWHIIKDIPNLQLRHIILENNDNRPVTYTRDTQEIGLKQGLEMLKIFKSYWAKTSILDDLNFYENREKSLKAKRSSKPAAQTEIYKDNYLNKHVKAEDRLDVEEKVATNSSNTIASLINLTKNLSINPSTLKSGAGSTSEENSVPSLSTSEVS